MQYSHIWTLLLLLDEETTSDPLYLYLTTVDTGRERLIRTRLIRIST